MKQLCSSLKVDSNYGSNPVFDVQWWHIVVTAGGSRIMRTA